VHFSSQLPEQVRQRFVDGFSSAASHGLEVGSSSSSAAGAVSGLPPQVAAEIGRIAHDVFAYAFIDAMKPTLLVPVAVLAIGAVSCLGIKRRQRTQEAPARRAEAPSATVGE